jgi:hypothetical protein
MQGTQAGRGRQTEQGRLALCGPAGQSKAGRKVGESTQGKAARSVKEGGRHTTKKAR